MTPDDIQGFYAKRRDLDLEDYIELDFTFECAGDPREAAAHLCSEQSTAQWRRVGVDEDFRPRSARKCWTWKPSRVLPGSASRWNARRGGRCMRCASPSPIRTAISGRASPICSPRSAARAFSSRPASR